MSDGSLGIPDIEDPEVIGRGSFGVVYRARQSKLGRTIAVKVIDEQTLDDAARLRFTRECQAMGALSGHPNVVMVFDSGFTPEGRPYLLLEYLPDGSLGDRIREHGPLDVDRATRYTIKVAGALESVHRMGVLHRDVKPDNVLLDRYDEPKLCDFGIAWVAGTSATRTAAIMGSPAYMAPEVIRGQATSARSDIYALAATLYVLLSSSEAFRKEAGETIGELLVRIAAQEPPDLRPAVPDPVWQIIARGLAKDPTRRPPTPLSFAADLNHARAAIGLEPVEAQVTTDDHTTRPTAIPARTTIGPGTTQDTTAPPTGHVPAAPVGPAMATPPYATPTAPAPAASPPSHQTIPPPVAPVAPVAPIAPAVHATAPPSAATGPVPTYVGPAPATPAKKDRTLPILGFGALVVVLLLALIFVVATRQGDDVVTPPVSSTPPSSTTTASTAPEVDLVQALVPPSSIGKSWNVDDATSEEFTGFAYLEPCNEKVDLTGIEQDVHVAMLGQDAGGSAAQSFQAVAAFADDQAATSFLEGLPKTLDCKTWRDKTLEDHVVEVEQKDWPSSDGGYLATDTITQGKVVYMHDLAFYRIGRFVGFITNLSLTPNDPKLTDELVGLAIDQLATVAS